MHSVSQTSIPARPSSRCLALLAKWSLKTTQNMQGAGGGDDSGRLPFWQEKQSRQPVERKKQLDQETEGKREEMEGECEANA